MDIWTSFRKLIESEKSMPGVYPDLSKWHMVFFGDSVLANYSGSSSIPGCMAGVSHISFDNYAVGGSIRYVSKCQTGVTGEQEALLSGQLWSE